MQHYWQQFDSDFTQYEWSLIGGDGEWQWCRGLTWARSSVIRALLVCN